MDNPEKLHNVKILMTYLSGNKYRNHFMKRHIKLSGCNQSKPPIHEADDLELRVLDRVDKNLKEELHIQEIYKRLR